MDAEREWFRIRTERPSLKDAGMGAVRVSLLFGMAAVALALLLTPFAERQARSQMAGNLDLISTGTVRAGNSYTIRRSVLQPHPRSVCIIRQNGSRSGEC